MVQKNNFHSILIVIFEPFELETSYIAHSTRICKTRRLRTCRARLEQPFDLEVENTDLIFYFSDAPKEKIVDGTTDIDRIFYALR